MQCPRCGSTDRRPGGKGCAGCNRRTAREQASRRRELDFPVTPAMRAYLAAFDRYLLAGKEGDTRAARTAEADRHQLLIEMERG